MKRPRFSRLPRAIQEIAYEEAAQAYARSLLPEPFTETIGQSQQRQITLASLALLQVHRPEVRLFNHLLVEYPLRGQCQFEQVVPDNMVVLTDQRVQASTSYNVSQEPVKPFWMLEYVSKHNPRKNYDESLDKYERELKVPYVLSFFPDGHHLTLYHHTGRKYVSVTPNAQGRHALPELDLDVGLLDGWVRF